VKIEKREKPVKAVIDTNVLVSGLFAETGSVAALMELWIDEQFELVTSEEILSELYPSFTSQLFRNISSPLKMTSSNISRPSERRRSQRPTFTM